MTFLRIEARTQNRENNPMQSKMGPGSQHSCCVAFSSESRLPVSDLDERLRKSEQKKRQLQRRIKELIGED